jgi:hypothetical protein
VHLENGVIDDLSEPLRHPEERDYTMSNNLLKNNSQPMMKRKVTLRNKKSVIVESLLLDKKTLRDLLTGTTNYLYAIAISQT